MPHCPTLAGSGLTGITTQDFRPAPSRVSSALAPDAVAASNDGIFIPLTNAAAEPWGGVGRGRARPREDRASRTPPPGDRRRPRAGGEFGGRASDVRNTMLQHRNGRNGRKDRQDRQHRKGRKTRSARWCNPRRRPGERDGPRHAAVAVRSRRGVRAADGRRGGPRRGGPHPDERHRARCAGGAAPARPARRPARGGATGGSTTRWPTRSGAPRVAGSR